MSLTISDAARYAHVSQGTIAKLLKAGHLQAAQDGPHKHWRITAPKADIKRMVAEHSPSSGWKKNAKPVTHRLKVRRMRPARTPDTLRDALAFAALDGDKRTTLLALAARFTDADLQLLLTL